MVITIMAHITLPRGNVVGSSTGDPMYQPEYIIIEGIDGNGKSTQADMLFDAWKDAGRNPLRVNEPDETLPTGKLLRQLLKSGEYPETHAALFMADRMAIHTRKIAPALAAGRPVVSSRSFLSTLVYQQDQWPLEWLCTIHEMLPVKADIIFILDLDPKVALGRVGSRGEHKEVYEKLDIMKRCRQRYLDIEDTPSLLAPWMTQYGMSKVIPANGSPEEVFEQIQELVPSSVKGIDCDGPTIK